MSDYYTESQMQRIEQAAFDGAMLEAGREWERQRGEFGATEAELQYHIDNLEDRIANAHRILTEEMSGVSEIPTRCLSDHYLQLRQALDFLEGKDV
jgi:cytochrome c biogenesis factor